MSSIQQYGKMMEEDREVRLCSVNNSLDAQCIVDLLKKNGIASYKKSGIMEIYGGSSIENDIYVSETNYDRAMQIVKEYHMLEGNKEDAEDVQRNIGESMPKGVMYMLIMVILLIFMAAALAFLCRNA